MDDFCNIAKGYKPIYLNQRHSDIIHVVEEPIVPGIEGDALVTSLRKIILIIKTADCLPILLVDKKHKAVAAVHCGWKGTASLLIQKVLLKMKAVYGSDMSLLMAALGPCIGPNCYEVGEDVRKKFGGEAEAFRPHPLKPEKYFLNLQQANLIQMRKLGMKDDNIFCIPECTHCGNDFYSYRRNEQNEERMLSFIGLLF
jgi:hypothetical protein